MGRGTNRRGKKVVTFQKLLQRERGNRPIKVAVVGAGMRDCFPWASPTGFRFFGTFPGIPPFDRRTCGWIPDLFFTDSGSCRTRFSPNQREGKEQIIGTQMNADCQDARKSEKEAFI
jgi:hypothetical protein